MLVPSTEVSLTEGDMAFIQKYLETNLRINRNMVYPGSYPNGSVGTTALADGSVTTAKIADDNVTAPKIFVPAVRATGPAKAIPTGVITAYNLWNAATPNNGAMFNAAAPDRVTIVEPGVYFIGASWTWAALAGGERVIYITVNGGQVWLDARAVTPGGNSIGFGGVLGQLGAGAFVGLSGFQNAAANLNLQPELHVHFVSSL